jgi:hypothetical protein
MIGRLRCTPARGEAADQGRRGHHGPAKFSDQLHDPGGHPVQIRDRVFRRDFHCEPLPADERAQLLMQFLPSGVGTDLAGKPTDRLQLDLVRNGCGLTLSRDKHEQPPASHAADSQHPAGDRIDRAKIVEQPAVELEFLEAGLNRRDLGRSDHQYPPTGIARQWQASSPRPRQRSWTISPSKPVIILSNSPKAAP